MIDKMKKRRLKKLNAELFFGRRTQIIIKMKFKQKNSIEECISVMDGNLFD
jgi:hypothetical protein